MDVLEKLYDCAAFHVGHGKKDWGAFAGDFKAIFEAEMALYRVAYKPDGHAVENFEFIATTQPGITTDYLEREVYLERPLPETQLTPLEPRRRTDDAPDETFRRMGEAADFLIANGLFYLMAVPARLPDGSYVALVVWRDEPAGDFSDVEKQRLALFMRYLLSIVGSIDPGTPHPDGDVAAFGKRYRLTDAEVQVLSALLQGHSLKEFATRTGRSYGTVRWHVQNILEKCQVKSQKNLLREFYQLIKA